MEHYYTRQGLDFIHLSWSCAFKIIVDFIKLIFEHDLPPGSSSTNAVSIWWFFVVWFFFHKIELQRCLFAVLIGRVRGKESTGPSYVCQSPSLHSFTILIIYLPLVHTLAVSGSSKCLPRLSASLFYHAV